MSSLLLLPCDLGLGASVASTGKSSSVRAWVRAGLAGRPALAVGAFSGAVSAGLALVLPVVCSLLGVAGGVVRAVVNLSFAGCGWAADADLVGIAAGVCTASCFSTFAFSRLSLLAVSGCGVTNLLLVDCRTGLAGGV